MTLQPISIVKSISSHVLVKSILVILFHMSQWYSGKEVDLLYTIKTECMYTRLLKSCHTIFLFLFSPALLSLVCKSNLNQHDNCVIIVLEKRGFALRYVACNRALLSTPSLPSTNKPLMIMIDRQTDILWCGDRRNYVGSCSNWIQNTSPQSLPPLSTTVNAWNLNAIGSNCCTKTQ